MITKNARRCRDDLEQAVEVSECFGIDAMINGELELGPLRRCAADK